MAFIKVSKLNENKIKIIITFHELKKRNISLNDLKSDSKKAKKLFMELIKESNIDKSFIYEESELFIEANTNKTNLLIITITKLTNFKDLDSYNLLHSNKPNVFNNNIFIFNNMNDIFNAIEIIKLYNIFIGKNSLYKFKNQYVLIFSRYAIKNYNFNTLNDVLLEYSDNSSNALNLEYILKEQGNIVILNKALQELTKI